MEYVDAMKLGSHKGNGGAMLSRESVPLHDEIPVFAELAAIRVSNENLGAERKHKAAASLLSVDLSSHQNELRTKLVLLIGLSFTGIFAGCLWLAFAPV